MARTLYVTLIGILVLALTGCGGGGSNSGSPQAFYTTTILSDPNLDGDIEQVNTTTFIITQGMSSTVQSVFAGVDPVSFTETRAFLDFPLGGANGVPYNAVIDSAALDIFINSVQTNSGTVPILIDLVETQPSLSNTDFDRNLLPALATISIVPPISPTDVGNYVHVDITALMVLAQSMGLPDFQIRILEDSGTSVGLIEINDTTGTNRPSLAPLLTVTYH